MKMNTICLAMAAILPATGAFAAALDRSGQPIGAFLQPNNYFEAGVTILSPDVQGQEAGQDYVNAPYGRHINNMAGNYLFGNIGVKFQPTEMFSFGVLEDHPFGASTAYTGNNIFVATPNDSAFTANFRTGLIEKTFSGLTQQQIIGAAAKATAAKMGITDLTSTAFNTILQQTTAAYATAAGKTQIDTAVKAGVAQGVDAALAPVAAKIHGQSSGGTKVGVSSHTFSILMGASPNKNVTVYGGPVYQILNADVALRGEAYSVLNGYNLSLPTTEAWGWLAGAAYQRPEIALKAAVTYRSKITHKIDAVESGYDAYGALGSLTTAQRDMVNGFSATSGQTSVSTPQSVNIDLQSGIMKDTLAFASIRWVNWKNFALRPYHFGQISSVITQASKGNANGFDLVTYDEDQWTVNAGVGRKLSDKVSVQGSVGWDSGTGELAGTLGPTNGYWNVGVGMQFSPAPNYFVAGGVKYLWLGDAKAQSASQYGTDGYLAEFTDNHALAYGLKLGYRF